MKQCRDCGSVKPYEEFYKDSHMAEGRLNSCKICVLARCRIRNECNIEASRLASMARSRIKRQSPEWRERNGDRLRAYRRSNPEKTRAHEAVRYAIKSGKMQRQPCERCGSAYCIQAHHDDYSKPLEVRWLCHIHHAERHAELAEMQK